MDKDGGLTATVTVTNTGKVAGKDVVQLYLSALETADMPDSELKAFAKTCTLAPGESETLTLSVAPYLIGSFDEASNAFRVAAGKYTVRFAASCLDTRLQSVVTLPARTVSCLPVPALELQK